MKTLEDVIVYAKRLLTKHGGLDPTLLIEGTTGSDTRPLPELPEAAKLSLLEALGFTIASENHVGDLQHLFLVSEGWRSSAPYTPGVAMTLPKYAPDRVSVLLVAHYDLQGGRKQLMVYDLIRNAASELIELKAVSTSGDGMELVESKPLEAIIRGFQRGRQQMQVT